MILMILLVPLLAESGDNWVSGGIGALGTAGPLGWVVWYLLNRTIPGIEAAHKLQQAENRVDLLALAEKERELAKQIVSVFANSQNVTVADNQRAINGLSEAVEATREMAQTILEKMKADTSIADELAASRRRLAEYEAKFGSDLQRYQNSGRRKPSSDTKADE